MIDCHARNPVFGVCLIIDINAVCSNCASIQWPRLLSDVLATHMQLEY